MGVIRGGIIMKKILFAMAVLAALASCQKADLAEQNSVNTNGERVITAYFDNAGTKTTLDDNGVTPKWSENDKIMLLDGSGKQEITLDADDISSDGKSVTITTTLEGTIYAVYPSTATSAEKVVDENSVPVTLSAENQDGTFASANICVAKEDDGSLAFKNVTSVLHLEQTASTGVNEIILTTPSAYIAGTGTVDMSAATPALSLSAGQSKKIKVKSASVKTDYYIAVVPTTLPAGTAFGFATGSALGGTNLSEEKIIAANTIYNIGSMDESELGSNKYHEYVEINGLKWATMNIGAASVSDAGHYFAWGYAEGCVRNTAGSEWVLASNNTIEKYFNTADFPDRDASSFQDAATSNWGGSWRMPTKDEFEDLINKASSSADQYESQDGVSFSYEGEKIFLPTAGYGHGINLVSQDENYYWSSSHHVSYSSHGWSLYIKQNTPQTQDSESSFGFLVRAISD